MASEAESHLMQSIDSDLSALIKSDSAPLSNLAEMTELAKQTLTYKLADHLGMQPCKSI